MKIDQGFEMYEFAKELFPICRSITGDGVRQTLKLMQKHIPQLKIFEIPTGSHCFDWTVPKEWSIKDAYIEDMKGKKIIEFSKSNLHVVSYSQPINKVFKFDELRSHLHYLENKPNSIPYLTSYYKEDWGFCLTKNQFLGMKDDEYRVVIDSSLKNGSLTYGELLIPGQSEKEVFISTYICHPSLANNEVSGPVLGTFLGRILAEKKKNKYSYRIIFVPETIGAIVYLSKNLDELQKKTFVGFNLTCVGDNLKYSFMPSRKGNTLSDKVARHVLKFTDSNYDSYSFLERGSDERQYCSPGVDLPVVSIMRSKYGTYPEYHTSEDDLDFISPAGLSGSLNVHLQALKIVEENSCFQSVHKCEPQMGKRGLRSNLGGKSLTNDFKLLSNILAYADGELDLIDLADHLNVFALDLIEPINLLRSYDLLMERKVENSSSL